ncbi:MAG: hypothetical protein E7459_04580 [Ruminococcaceae bacterium]|nr:hypothetical protein [Oscillospiraceae bacterium]
MNSNRVYYLLLCILLSLVLLFGCQQKSEDVSASDEAAAPSTDVTDARSVVLGTLATERIQTSSWDSGRTEQSSGYFAAETEAGFYFEYGGQLFYADKADLSNWVAVCAVPECAHTCVTDMYMDVCGAYVGGSFLLKDERIYYLAAKTYDPKYWSNVSGFNPRFIASMAPDGTDRRVEHIFGLPEGVIRSGSGGGTLMTDGQNFLNSEFSLNKDGLYDSWITVVDKDGEYILFSETLEDQAPYAMTWRHLEGIYGDTALYFQMMDNEMGTAFYLRNRELTSVDISGLPYTGAYLSGNTMWVFRPGDGYYAVDLTTREEVRLADCQLETSVSHIMQPNCILESTFVGWNAVDISADVEEHSLRFFDGEQWHDIAVPEELQNLEEREYLEPMALASDRILFALVKVTGENREQFVYQIVLGTDEPVLELLGKLG